MLEARSAYGYFGAAGGVTGETPPPDFGCIQVNMPYREYKSRYPECGTLNDYDKVRKTITVLIPQEYTERGNFGNRYSMHEFFFVYEPAFNGYSNIFECKAKCYTNAIKAAKKWAKQNGVVIIGDEPGREYQQKFK